MIRRNKLITTFLTLSSCAIITIPLISTQNNEQQFNISYINIDNIYTNNLTKSYTPNKNTILNIPKTKKGYIFLNWVDSKYNFPLDYIPALETGNIILKPILIKEYIGFSEAERDFLLSKKQNPILKQLLTNISLANGYDKFKLQEEFVYQFKNKIEAGVEQLIENLELQSYYINQNPKNYRGGALFQVLKQCQIRF
ncbi:hypothetical protein [Mycoplasma phocimorsus]|uniref:hypothetical protein n=1 Tax=Mycoplasma phocimorsus TaxID=3045839 RepID=UPI0024C08C7B|nr:hypothetical protein [Mycoplasma phocimorsus]MDJ1649061.1 hypothetical protein [Mycoplasma phocimorsus]